MNPQQSQYATQFLIKSAKHEPQNLLFRRVQRVMWEWLKDELFVSEGGRKMFSDEIPFDLFRCRDNVQVEQVEAENKGGAFLAKYLETGKLLSHAVRCERRLRSELAENGSDRSLVEDVCIEAAKSNPMFEGVRFAYSSGLVLDPFLGFFNPPERIAVVSSLVRRLLETPDIVPSFWPWIRSSAQMSEATLSYPLSGKPFRAHDESSVIEFIDRLRDPFRPICLVAFMSDSRRAETEARILAKELESKAHVWILRRTERLEKGLSETIPGFNVHENFSGLVCRVFFPIPRYSPFEAHNPKYRIRTFGGTEYRALVLRGIFQFFRIQEPGWRTDVEDVDMSQWELRQRRSKNVRDEAQSAGENTVSHLNELLRKSRTEARDLQAERDAAQEEANKNANEVARLTAQVGDLTAVVGSLRKEMGTPEPPKTIRALPHSLEETLLWAKDFLPHLVILPSALKSAREDNGQRDIGTACDILRAMDSTLYDLRYGKNAGGNIGLQFGEKTRFCYADESETTKNIPAVRKERRLIHEGRNFDFWLHIKSASHNKEAKLIRAYFAFDDANRKILIGFFGPHLRNSATQYVR